MPLLQIGLDDLEDEKPSKFFSSTYLYNMILLTRDEERSGIKKKQKYTSKGSCEGKAKWSKTLKGKSTEKITKSILIYASYSGIQ